jgi:hypothetical protein
MKINKVKHDYRLLKTLDSKMNGTDYVSLNKPEAMYETVKLEK